VLKGGLLIGLGASVIGAASPGLSGVADAAVAPNPQPNWWWCSDCDGLFFSNANGAPNGVCQSEFAPNGKHNSSGSSNYSVLNGESSSSNRQAGWRWCKLCQLLFWGNGAANSACPANSGTVIGGQIQVGPHIIGSSTVYDLVFGVTAPGDQLNWRWCNLCQGIFWGPRQSNSACTGTERHDQFGNHSIGSSTNYDMIFTFG
jgi:hypothetical protein